MTAPLVSVVMAVYNGERYVRDAVASIIVQAHRPLELIVVDDGSTDGTAACLQDLDGVRYVRQDNGGQPSALNHGIRLASGTLLAFNDADDLWAPDKLRCQLAALAEDTTLDAVFGHAEQFLEPDAPPAVVAGLTEDRRIIPSQLPTSMLIRREAFDRVGGFDESSRIGAVVDWYHRAVGTGLRSRMLADVVVRRRLHANNIGWQQRDVAKSAYLDVVRRAVERRKAAAAAAAAAAASAAHAAPTASDPSADRGGAL